MDAHFTTLTNPGGSSHNMAENGDTDRAPETIPLNGAESLQPSVADSTTKRVHPQSEVLPGDSAVTKAEKIERHGNGDDGREEERASKRLKLEQQEDLSQPGRVKGRAPIKQEYLVDITNTKPTDDNDHDDDEAEAAGKSTKDTTVSGRGGQKTKGGQNHARQFGSSFDAIQLCKSRATVNESAPQSCRFGNKCKFSHDIRKYLSEGKRGDLDTFGGNCPIWEIKGKCSAGWKCRFVGSHSKEIEHEDGTKELVLITRDDDDANRNDTNKDDDDGDNIGVMNIVGIGDKITLRKKKFPTPKSDKYTKYLNTFNESDRNGGNDAQDNRAAYVEPPLRASEKRRIYYGAETPVLAPLTTQGNLPYRRLCVSLGAQITWSEMAMGVPLITGEKAEWALIKAHESETTSPKYTPKNIVHDYDNSKDMRFGVQIAANKPWLALKTTEVLTTLCPHLRAIDLNCGCPIELVCRQGAGSALLDTPGKLEKTLRGMNVVSNEVPITVKIRMGTKDKQPTAEKLCQRFVLGGGSEQGSNEGPAGVAAITLHGRSKQQRYTRSADWEYIAECASLIKKLRAERAEVTDTVREPDARDLAVTSKSDGLPYFCGNGDILSHVDYNDHMEHAGVDSCMIGRGALIKPWIFEEIATGQYLDKSASERLQYIEQFVRHGLEYWGSDEFGVGTTRRFLLEWLSFSCRYIPIGLLEYLPPKFGDRPPAFRGRSDLETLLSSSNYKDWIKISEMFLGKAHENFRFEPKHKSNSYEIEAEG